MNSRASNNNNNDNLKTWEDVCRFAEHSAHAALSYNDVASLGADRPLDFPTPSVYRCKRINTQAIDHRTGKVHDIRNLIVRSERDNKGRIGEAGYLVKKKLAKSVYGSVRLCVVLKRRTQGEVIMNNASTTATTTTNNSNTSNTDDINSNDDYNQTSTCCGANDSFSTAFVEWESTDLLAVIKASSWDKIRHLRGRHLEDPIKEVSALQYIGDYHPHVMGTYEVLQDDLFLYTVIPHLPGGDLYGRIMSACFDSDRPAHNSASLHEDEARKWFRELLLGLFHLQKKGVCHRDISLENLLLDENDRLVIIDPGMSLRIPYDDPWNYGATADVSAGTARKLLKGQGQGGALMYTAPEVINGEDVFDGFAIDLWSAGVVLFVMLVGLAPFKWAHPSDKRFIKIASEGGLKDLIQSLDIPLSDEVCDLLQNMFWRDPRRRLSLAQIMQHPWVVNRPESVTANNVKNKQQSIAATSCSVVKGYSLFSLRSSSSSLCHKQPRACKHQKENVDHNRIVEHHCQ